MSNSEDQKKRDAAIEALRSAPTMADKNAKAGIKKQNVRESFVYKVLFGTEDPAKIGDYIDAWTPESMMQLHDYLGFDEREWLMIVSDNRAFPFILQERAFRLGKIPVDKFNYAKLLDQISQKDQDIETIVKSAMDPTGVLNGLVAKGVLDRVPNHLMVSYRAYGWMQHKLFIDLQDIATVKFDWDKLIKPVTPVVPEVKQIEPVAVEVKIEVTPEVQAAAEQVKDAIREGLKGFIGEKRPEESEDSKKVDPDPKVSG